MADAHPEDTEERPARGAEPPDRHDDPARDARRRDDVDPEEEPEHGSDSAASQSLRRTAGPEGTDSVDRM